MAERWNESGEGNTKEIEWKQSAFSPSLSYSLALSSCQPIGDARACVSEPVRGKHFYLAL